MYLVLLPIAIGLLCGGHWIDSEWLYNLHPAAALGIGILTYTVIPNTTQRTHDHKLYEMFIIVAREQEYRFLALLEKLQIDDPVDKD